jgi:hypothetical protein
LVVTGKISAVWGLTSLRIFRPFFHGHKVAAEAVGVLSELKAGGRMTRDGPMPAEPVHLDQENIFLPRFLPFPAHLARTGSHGQPSLAVVR